MSFASFIRLIPRYFIFFGHYEWECTWSSFSLCFLVVCRKTVDLCRLIPYPITLPNLFIVSRSFLVEFLGSLLYDIVCRKGQFDLYFPICISSFYFLALLLQLMLQAQYWQGVGIVNIPVYFMVSVALLRFSLFRMILAVVSFM